MEWGDGKACYQVKNIYLKTITRIRPLSQDLSANEKPSKHPFFIKNIPYRYSLCEMKNMSKGITSFKFNKGPQAYKLKKR